MKPVSRHIARLLMAHRRADYKTWPKFKRTPTQKRRRLADDRVFVKKMEVEDRLKQGRRIWWPKGENGHIHLFGRSPIALAEGSLTPRPNPRPTPIVPIGRDRFFINTIPF